MDYVNELVFYKHTKTKNEKQKFLGYLLFLGRWLNLRAFI